MISHDHKCIFVHIPKCAGTSIEEAFGHYARDAAKREVDHRSIRMMERPITWRALTTGDNLEQLLRRGHYLATRHENPNNRRWVTRKQFREYFKFTIVRNPWARAYSWYKNVMRNESNQERLGVKEEMELGEFLKRYVLKNALRPQPSWLVDFSGRIGVDFIGCMSSLNQDFEFVCEKVGLRAEPLQKIREGHTGGFREHYDDSSIDLIAKAYAEEIELFGFEFDSDEMKRDINRQLSTTSR